MLFFLFIQIKDLVKRNHCWWHREHDSTMKHQTNETSGNENYETRDLVAMRVIRNLFLIAFIPYLNKNHVWIAAAFSLFMLWRGFDSTRKAKKRGEKSGAGWKKGLLNKIVMNDYHGGARKRTRVNEWTISLFIQLTFSSHHSSSPLLAFVLPYSKLSKSTKHF